MTEVFLVSMLRTASLHLTLLSLAISAPTNNLHLTLDIAISSPYLIDAHAIEFADSKVRSTLFSCDEEEGLFLDPEIHRCR